MLVDKGGWNPYVLACSCLASFTPEMVNAEGIRLSLSRLKITRLEGATLVSLLLNMMN